jgi:ATP-dependent RNA/DNA helicase IGHMBP2
MNKSGYLPSSHHLHFIDLMLYLDREISEWSSHEMYHDRLRSHASNEAHTLLDLIADPTSQDPPMALSEDLKALSSTVMLLIDTAGCNMEEDGCRGGSYRNLAEAEIVVAHIYRLYELGLRPEQIGVITPYNGQLELLRELVAAREGNGMSLGEPSMSAKGLFLIPLT